MPCTVHPDLLCLVGRRLAVPHFSFTYLPYRAPHRDREEIEEEPRGQVVYRDPPLV